MGSEMCIRDRSFTEPAGLLPSNFARKTLLHSLFVFPGIEDNFTNGVFPIACSSVSCILTLYDFFTTSEINCHYKFFNFFNSFISSKTLSPD